MSMSVEMILRLIDRASGPLRGVESELNRLKSAADKVNSAQTTAGKMRASEWVERQRQIKAEIDGQAVLQSRWDATRRAMLYSGAAVALEKAGNGFLEAQVKALEVARQHQSVAQSIATAGGLVGKEDAIGRGILETSKRTGVDWKSIAAGERQLVALGGGEFLDKIAVVRDRVARLSKASETDVPELYNALYHYIELNGLSAQNAVSALEKNYLQGRKGAYELKDLARGIPALAGLAKSYGLTGEQAAIDIPAMLQSFRKVTGTASEADTRLRHILTKLTSEGEAKKISEELNLDIFKIRDRAMKDGKNPLLATLDAISDRLDKIGPKAAEKLGSIGRDYYFRAGLDAYRMGRGSLGDFMPSSAEASQAVNEAFDANSSTAAAAHERAANAWEVAGAKIAKPWLELDRSAAKLKEKVANALGDFGEKNPGLLAAGSLGAAGGLYAGSAMMARKAFLETSRAWAEGAAKATGAAVADASPGVLGGAIRATWPGLIAAATWGARRQIEAAITGKDAGRIADERAFFSHRLFNDGHRGENASDVFGRMRNLYMPVPPPIFTQPRPQAASTIPGGGSLPTFAARQGVPGTDEGGGAIKPHVDSGEIKEAASAAQGLKEALGGLNVNVTPNVGTGSLVEALGLAKQLLGTLNAIGSAGSRASGIVRGVSASTNALHDGPESH